jgi:hypothetical protein
MHRLAVCSALFVSCAFSQTFNARISGTVTDSSGAPVPRATVTSRNIDQNIKKSAASDDSGIYSIPLLLPGNYEVTVEAKGLQTQIRKDILLEVNQTATLDFTLPVSQVSTAVDVTADVPMLQTETSSVGTTLETKIIEDYPLIERDIMGALKSIPGIITSSQVGAARGSRNVFDSTFSVAGGRSSTNEVLIDGAANTIGDFNGVVILPPPDSVQELRVETSSYSAEFGRSGGGAVNIVTKSGTNKYHGNTYYYHQNTELNANSFTNNRNNLVRPRLRRHQYGGTFGGPVWIPKIYKGENKTFFFVSYEGRRENNPTSQGPFDIPTAAEMSGDFSKTFVFPGGKATPITIYDPSATTLVNGRYVRQAFPNNIIPPDRISKVARNVLSYYPAPNRPGNIYGRQNYIFDGQQQYSRDVFSSRVDQFFSEKHRLFARMNLEENLEKNPGTIVMFASTTSTHDNFKNIGFDDTYSFSVHVSNVLRYNYTRFRANLVPGSLGFDPTTLGLPSYIRDTANVLTFPNFSFGFVDMGGPYNFQPRDTQSASDQVLWNRGRHNLRMGAEYRLYRFYPYQVLGPTGTYNFGQGGTERDPLATPGVAEGFGLASFLVGVGNFSFEHREPLSLYHHYAAGYVQDDWKVNSSLTLNLGLRYDVETGTGEAHNRLSYFDPTAPNPIPNGPKGAILFTGNGNPSTIRATNWKNFGPRAGFAYRLGSKMSVRGGYGIYYLPLGVESDIAMTPFSYTLSADVLNQDYTPKATLDNPFPGGLPAPSSARRVDDGSYRLGTNASIVERNQPSEYMQEWNFGVSRQLGRTMVVDATYYGSRGVHLPVPNVELNQLPSQYLAQGGAFLNQRVPNPYQGLIPGSSMFSGATVPQGQLLKPFPQFASNTNANYYGTSLAYSRPPIGDSVYHAVTFKFEKRYSRGLSISAAYTISKLIDIGGVGNGAAFTDASGIRDIYNVRLERSVSAWDVPQRTVINYRYELPFGRGKQFLNRGGILDRIVGGWELLSVHTFESGRPIAVGGPDLSRLASTGPSRASVVAGVDSRIPLGTAEDNARAYDPNCNCTGLWFNPKAFTTTPEFVVPNGPRFLPNDRTDHVMGWDATVNKRFRIHEGTEFVIVGHAYNLLNSVYFGAPNGTVTSASFGQNPGIVTSPRRLEVGAKISF